LRLVRSACICSLLLFRHYIMKEKMV